MKTHTRRSFLKTAATGLTGVSLLKASSAARAAGANERIAVAVIGCGRQGGRHAQWVTSLPGATLAAICDPDEGHLSETAKQTKCSKTVKDMRKIFDDRSIDAVIIATPDHWHAPAALLAMEAGKHVYLEKPCSHNVREGRLVGLTVMCDPANFRPTRYHARDYGFVAANPFGRKCFKVGEESRVVVKPGESLRLRYGVLIHECTEGKPLDLAAEFQAFVATLDTTKSPAQEKPQR